MKTIFSILILILISASAQAANEDVNVLRVDPENTVIADSSEHHRIGKNFSIYLETASGSLIAGGLGLSRILDRKSQILVDGYGYSNVFTDVVVGSITGVHDQFAGSSVGIHYKRFFGNSFFVRGGTDYRKMTLTRSYEGGIFNLPASEKSTVEGEALNAVVGIGNDWQWSYFTLGCDWLRYYLPLSSRLTRENYATNSEVQSMRDLADDYLQKPSLMIGFHLGATF